MCPPETPYLLEIIIFYPFQGLLYNRCLLAHHCSSHYRRWGVCLMVHIVSKIYYLVSLKKRRTDSRLILLYKGLKGKASIPTDDLIPLVRRCRNDHSMAYQVPIANTDTYKCSFPPQTIRDWNALSDSLISSAEGAEDGVAKFTSLVRARD